MIKKFLFLIIVLNLMPATYALEKTKEEKVAKFVLENMHKEYTSCYAFYKIAEESFKISKADKSIVDGLIKSADTTLKYAHDLGEVLNFKSKDMFENNKIEIKKLNKIAKKDFNLLSKKYGFICKNLVENQKQRIDYWENKGNKKIK
jgi:hypothetical protein